MAIKHRHDLLYFESEGAGTSLNVPPLQGNGYNFSPHMKQHLLLLLASAVSQQSALILDVLKHMAWLLLFFFSPYSINKYTSFFRSSQNNRLFLTLLPPECNRQIKILEEQDVMLSRITL